MNRPQLLALAIELAHWEAAAWQPSFDALLAICETAPKAAREFIAKAILPGDSKDESRYRLPADLIAVDDVYRLYESADAFASSLGMQLIARDPALANPEALFRLTDSPDRRTRSFAVDATWRRYRDAGATANWQPKEGTREAPHSHPWLSGPEVMQSFLRRMLYEVPPAKFAKTKQRLRTLPACKAKLALIDIYSQMAQADAEFAALVAPSLREFMGSRGKSERRACIVALTRISQCYPTLVTAQIGQSAAVV